MPRLLVLELYPGDLTNPLLHPPPEPLSTKPLKPTTIPHLNSVHHNPNPLRIASRHRRKIIPRDLHIPLP